MWKLEITESAVENIKKLDRQVQRKIIEKLEYFVLSQKPLGFAKKMIGTGIGQYRFRVGDYRVIFDVIDTDVVKVLLVGHRREVYK